MYGSGVNVVTIMKIIADTIGNAAIAADL